MKRLLLLPLLFLALAPAAARADELSDWQPVVQELFAAVKARNSGEEWNLPKMRARYEKIVRDLKAYQAAYPHPQHGDDLTDLITAMQRNADLLTWEQAGVKSAGSARHGRADGAAQGPLSNGASRRGGGTLEGGEGHLSGLLHLLEHGR